jgi:hypothetical protein
MKAHSDDRGSGDSLMFICIPSVAVEVPVFPGNGDTLTRFGEAELRKWTHGDDGLTERS